MFALVKFATISDKSMVKRIFQQILIIGNGKHTIASTFEAKFVNFSPNLGEGEVACGVCFKSLFHEYGFYRINDNSFYLFIIQIPERSLLWPYSVFEFLPVSAFDVFRQVIYIVFALTK